MNSKQVCVALSESRETGICGENKWEVLLSSVHNCYID